MHRRQWTSSEERLIRDKAGLVTTADLAKLLNRTRNSISVHACQMRKRGELDKNLKVGFQDEHVSYLRECCECHELRSQIDQVGICKVCRMREQLERNKETMDRAWRNLPPGLKDRAKRNHDPERAPKLMTKSRTLKEPLPPCVDGMDDFDANEAMDDWYRATEEYEMALLRLDIDAVKQRTCKWRRKTREFIKANRQIHDK